MANGIKFVLGVDGGGASHVQSVLFDKTEWVPSKARTWLASHGFRDAGVDDSAQYLRYRQASPKRFQRFATVAANPSIHKATLSAARAEVARLQAAGEVNVRLEPSGAGWLVVWGDGSHLRRTSPNFLGFGKKKAGKAAPAGKRSSATVAEAMRLAYRAGSESGDTGLFDAWVSSVGLASRGSQLRAKLKREYERGFEAGHEMRMLPRGVTTSRTGAGPRTFKGHKIWQDNSGGWRTSLDPESLFDSPAEVKAFITSQSKRFNPKRNPEDSAAEKFEEFHGTPSDRIEIVEEEIHYHENLAQLGDLCKVVVATPTGFEATFCFAGYSDKRNDFSPDVDESERPQLCVNEAGTQMYVIGGDQELDLASIKMDGDEWVKDSMLIGDVVEVTYQTAKQFDKFQVTAYYHALGEENGETAVLLYDVLNKQLSFAGGNYLIKPEPAGGGGSIFN